jgi:predicted metal-dependent HD superfamily phosphohydrolase
MPALITWWSRDLAAVAAAADAGAALDAGADLLRRWDEPHRRYHTTLHLVEMFRALEELEDVEEISAREGAVGRLAAWFHDAVYAIDEAADSPGSNEAASAELARGALSRLGCSSADVATVAGLVDDTVAHEVAASTGLRAAFHDADLWVLGAEPGRFDAYCAQVREEYAAVPEAAYALGRRAVLEPFLQRPQVYATAHAREQWEPAARTNLARELSRL